MKSIFILFFLITTTMSSQVLIDFKQKSDINDWQVVDDVVMGGESSGHFELTDDGHGRFFGEVSLENNGGFSSVQHQLETVSVNPTQNIRLKVKGDGKSYQFRVKHRKSDYYSYISDFETSGDWQFIDIKLETMKPQFRGRKLDLPNFNKKSIEQLTFLIGNKKPQEFELLIESISISE